MQRGDIEAVPGCSGEGVSRKDYCYSDGSTAPPISPHPTMNPSTANPTNAVTPKPTNSPVAPQVCLLCMIVCSHDLSKL